MLRKTTTCRMLALGLATFLLTGCAGVQRHTERPRPQPEAGKGLVYFFRPSAFLGGGVQIEVSDGSTTIGALQSGTYFFYQASPGPHQFGVSTEATNTITIDVETGKTYYVEGTISMGVLVGHGHLKQVDSSVGEQELPKLDWATLPKKDTH